VATEDLTRALDEAGTRYELLPHPETMSALAEAEALGVDPADVGKTLVVTTPEENIRAVVPANCRIDMHKLRDAVGAAGKKVHLATEDDLSRDYPEFDLGAVPPVGGSRRDRVLVDSRVAERESVVVEAGTHERSLRLATEELIRLTRAQIADICEET
jgi:Ala-tRNA(Pro) deacylase